MISARLGVAGTPVNVTVIHPGATLGVLGGGQLGAMFATAARRMGYASETVTHETMAQLEEIGKMLNGVLASLRRRLAFTNR